MNPKWEVRANLSDSLLYSTQSASLIWFEPVWTAYNQPQQTLLQYAMRHEPSSRMRL